MISLSSIIKQIYNDDPNQDRDLRQNGLTEMEKMFKNGEKSLSHAEFKKVRSTLFKTLYDEHSGVASQAILTLKAFLNSQDEKEVLPMIELIVHDLLSPPTEKDDSQTIIKAAHMASIISDIHPVFPALKTSALSKIASACITCLSSPLIDVIKSATQTIIILCETRGDLFGSSADTTVAALLKVRQNLPRLAHEAIVGLASLLSFSVVQNIASELLATATISEDDDLENTEMIRYSLTAAGHLAAECAWQDTESYSTAQSVISTVIYLIGRLDGLVIEQVSEDKLRAAAVDSIRHLFEAGIPWTAVPAAQQAPLWDFLIGSVEFNPLAAFEDASDDEGSDVDMDSGSDSDSMFGDDDNDSDDAFSDIGMAATEAWAVRVAGATAVRHVMPWIGHEHMAQAVQRLVVATNDGTIAVARSAVESLEANLTLIESAVGVNIPDIHPTPALADRVFKVCSSLLVRGAGFSAASASVASLTAYLVNSVDISGALKLLWSALGASRGPVPVAALTALSASSPRATIAVASLVDPAPPNPTAADAIVDIALASVSTAPHPVPQTVIARLLNSPHVSDSAMARVVAAATKALQTPTVNLVTAAARVVASRPDISGTGPMLGLIIKGITPATAQAPTNITTAAMDGLLAAADHPDLVSHAAAITALCSTSGVDTRLMLVLGKIATRTKLPVKAAEDTLAANLIDTVRRHHGAAADAVHTLALYPAIASRVAKLSLNALTPAPTSLSAADKALIKTLAQTADRKKLLTVAASSSAPVLWSTVYRHVLDASPTHRSRETLNALLAMKFQPVPVLEHVAAALGALVSYHPEMYSDIVAATIDIRPPEKPVSALSRLEGKPKLSAKSKEITDSTLRLFIRTRTARVAVECAVERMQNGASDPKAVQQIVEIATKAISFFAEEPQHVQQPSDEDNIALLAAMIKLNVPGEWVTTPSVSLAVTRYQLTQGAPVDQALLTLADAVTSAGEATQLANGLHNGTPVDGSRLPFVTATLRLLLDVMKSPAFNADAYDNLFTESVLLSAFYSMRHEQYFELITVKKKAVQTMDICTDTRRAAWAVLEQVLTRPLPPRRTQVLAGLVSTLPYISRSLVAECDPDLRRVALVVVDAGVSTWRVLAPAILDDVCKTEVGGDLAKRVCQLAGARGHGARIEMEDEEAKATMHDNE